MNNKKNKLTRFLPVLTTVLLGSLVIGCASGPSSSGLQEASAAAQAPARSGAEIWGDTCNRCHNYRDPGSYSDAQWNVAVMHMRVRAKLSGADAKAVLKFLQASN